MSRPDAVVGVVVDADLVLMIRRGPDGPDSGYWAPPGGGIEPGERQEDAVVREVREETGVTVRPIGKIWESVSASGTHTLHWWLGHAQGRELVLDHRAASDGRWVTVEEIATLHPTYAGDRHFFERVFQGARIAAGAVPLECVACLLVADGQVLAERRLLTRMLAPGAVAIPGGHVEAGERLEEAVCREVHEELGIVAHELRYVCTLLHRAEELRRIHYFAVVGWEGTIANHEAASLLWLPLNGLGPLDFDIDRIAVAELRRSTGDATR
jgi:8-oxo-dGTP diphosphatase